MSEFKRTSITLPAELVERVEEYNQTHRGAPIKYSGACRAALERMLTGMEVEK